MGTELITFLASFVLKTVQSHIANAQEIRKMEIEAMTRVSQAESEAQTQLREQFKSGYSLIGLTASVLAIIGFFSVILLPKLVAIFYPEVGITYAYEAIDKGFMFFTSDVTKMIFKATKGLLITPMDVHMVAAVSGLFFGGQVSRRLRA